MRIRRIGAGIAALAFAAAACGTVGGGTGGSNANQPAAHKDIKEVKIGFAQRTANAPYYVAMQKEAERLASEKGFQLLFQSANSDPVQQIDQVQTLISQGVDALIVNAVSPGTEKQQMTSAAGQKPLLFIDTPIPDVGFTTVQSDNTTIGQDSGKLLAQRIGANKSVKIAILNGGPTDVDVGPARRKGFLDGLTQNGVTPQIIAEATADYTQDEAVARTEDMLAAHPDINVIFGYNDAMALGALSVLQNSGKPDILVAGVDGQKEALAAIKKGGCSGQYVSTGLNSPALAARDAVQIATDIATGVKAQSDYKKVNYTQPAGIDCHNIDQYYDPASNF